MEALRSSETSFLTRVTRLKIPDDDTIHSYCRGILNLHSTRESRRFPVHWTSAATRLSDTHIDSKSLNLTALYEYRIFFNLIKINFARNRFKRNLKFLRSVRRLLVAACVVPSSPILSP
jgi:hypothetical protein